MNIVVIGTGFVGVVSSAVFASLGNHVYGLDVLEDKVKRLNAAELPFYEPGLKELVQSGLRAGALIFTTDYGEAIPSADVILVAVGTPSAPDGQADLRYVFAAAESAAPYLKDGVIFAIKSTVPPGTNKKVEEIIKSKTSVRFFTASLPEFLREGSAVQDTLHPDRVIIGTTEPSVLERLTQLHQQLGSIIVPMSPESAQMAKYAANAYLATRITFINQIANLCEVNGANIQEVIQGIGLDARIGKHYWYPGLGYGGSCFPKDVKELAAYSKAIGQNGNLMVRVNELNEERIVQLMDKYGQQIGGWDGKTVSLLGLSFKPNTDDTREAPSTKIIPYLSKKNVQIRGFDPMNTKNIQSLFPDWKIKYFNNVIDAIKNADVVILLVEWSALIPPTLQAVDIATVMKKPGVFIDTRNQYLGQRKAFEDQHIRYIGIGVT